MAYTAYRGAYRGGLEGQGSQVFGLNSVNVSADLKGFARSFSSIMASKMLEMRELTEAGEISQVTLLEFQLDINALQQGYQFALNVANQRLSMERDIGRMFGG